MKIFKYIILGFFSFSFLVQVLENTRVSTSFLKRLLIRKGNETVSGIAPAKPLLPFSFPSCRNITLEGLEEINQLIISATMNSTIHDIKQVSHTKMKYKLQHDKIFVNKNIK